MRPIRKMTGAFRRGRHRIEAFTAHSRCWWCAVVESYEGFTIIVSEPHRFAESWSMRISVQESISPQDSGFQNLLRPTITFSFGGYFPTKEVASTRALVAAQKLIGQLVAMGRL